MFQKSTPQKQIIFLILLPVFGAIWIGITAAFFPITTNGLTPAATEGFLSPDFNLPATAGDFHQLSDHRGKVIMINFWTSWCPYCKTEMPAMQRVYLDYQDQDFTILAINATYEDNQAKAETFIRENQLTFPTLLDIDGTVTRQYQVHSFPTTFFIDRSGVINEVIIGGPISEALMRTRIEKLLVGGE